MGDEDEESLLPKKTNNPPSVSKPVLKASPQLQVCGRCGRAVAASSRFCSQCGMAYDRSNPPSRPASAVPPPTSPRINKPVPAKAPSGDYGGYEVVHVEWNSGKGKGAPH
jgi:hypothetical protein